MPAWRYIAAGGAISSILLVFGGGAVAYADDRAPSAVDSGSRDTPSITDRSQDSTPRHRMTESSSQTETETETETAETGATDPHDADGSDESPRTDDPAVPPGYQDTSTDGTVDPSPEIPGDVPPDDDPTIDPPTVDTGAGTETETDPSTTQPDSSSGSVPAATVITTGPTSGDATAGITENPVSTDTSTISVPDVEPAPVVSVSPAVDNSPVTVDAPVVSAAEANTVVSVPVSAVVTTVPLASLTAAIAPPSILQWFALLTWAQLQWLIQQQLGGPGVTPVLGRLGGADPRLISAVYPNLSTTADPPMQLSWLRTTLDALQGMRLLGLPVDPALLQRTSATLAAETARLPAIAKALTDQVNARSGLQLSAPCVGAFIRNVSIWALFTAAALGIFGMISMTGLGAMVGFRQAKAGYALRAAGLARFSGPGPLGLVRDAGFVQIGSRRPNAERPRLHAVATHLRDSA
ncbi:MAG: hypothetical protein PGN37_14420 [Mycobacterium kyogaense]|uniref:hypothetical protein n=1 Tax=Mycobacterium kyogaense TaxID=2212479 RepID=UPI002FF7C849